MKITMVKMPLWLIVCLLIIMMIGWIWFPDPAPAVPEPMIDLQRIIECSGGSVDTLQKYICASGTPIAVDNILGPRTLEGWIIVQDGVRLYEETR